MTQFQPNANPNTTFNVISVSGGNNTQGVAGLEANLDIQYTVGLALGVPVTYVTVGGEFDAALLDTTTFLAGIDNPPTVLSTSYGADEDSFDPNLANDELEHIDELLEDHKYDDQILYNPLILTPS